LHFLLNFKKPDALEFSSSLGKRDFKIQTFGKTNLAKINQDFTYSAYEKDRLVKTLLVGLQNPNYTPISNISDHLKAAVLTSEDGNFYSHLGFNEEAFKKSIATNFKQKRFVRGGSTISMQLVKNVFLTRNKTLARKIEEAMIVWLIENNRIVSKERMLEVYLNIIEWGPGIYGIGEASRFYFNKLPSQLTLSESVFLAMIIPRPKGFAYNFGPDGKLKAHVAAYYALIADHLLKRGKITEEERPMILPDIDLVGQAKDFILKSDTISVGAETIDDILFDEE
jgi:membrane peptidoglycan carboxypeptidase